MLAISKYRKAMLRVCSAALAPVRDPRLNTWNPVPLCGGEAFVKNMRRLAFDDCGLADWIEVLRLGVKCPNSVQAGASDMASPRITWFLPILHEC